jgi:hypothetical protein
MSYKNRFTKKSTNKLYNPDDTLNFGKYNGRKIKDILDFDPEYLVWASNTITWFILPENIRIYAYKKATSLIGKNLKHNYRNYIDPEDSPFWFEDDGGSW